MHYLNHKPTIFFHYNTVPYYQGPSINDVMSEGGGGVRVRMTNNVKGCIKKHDMGGGGGVKNAPKLHDVIYG